MRSPYIWLAFLVALSGLVSGDLEVSLLWRVCDPNEPVIYFSNLEEVKAVLTIFRKAPNECKTASYHQSLIELDKLLQPEYLKDICSEKAYWPIRNFHTTFISPYTPEVTTDDLKEALKQHNLAPIPESIRRFFILFAKQTNASCRRNLVARLDELVGDEISDEDYELMKSIKDEGNRLFGPEYAKMNYKIDKLQLEMRRPEDDDEDSWLHVQVKFGDVLKKIQDACQAKFRPVYEELFSPVIRLANLGYHDISNTMHENKLLLKDKNFNRWVDIIETCESMKYIDVIQDTSTRSALADLIEFNSVYKNEMARRRAQAVVVLTADEARELKAKIADNTEKYSSATLYSPTAIKVTHLPIEASTLMWASDDKTREYEIKKFYDGIKNLINDKTSAIKIMMREVKTQVKALIRQHKLEFVSRDQESAFGQVAIFMDKHKFKIRVIGSILGFCVAMSVLFG